MRFKFLVINLIQCHAVLKIIVSAASWAAPGIIRTNHQTVLDIDIILLW